MAAGTLYSDQRANENAVPFTPNKPDVCGTVIRKYFSYTVAGTALDPGTTIGLVKAPKGSRFVGGKLYNDGTFAGPGVTVHIGDADDADRFAASIDVSGEAWTELPNSAARAGVGFGYLFPKETEILLTTVGDVIVATGVIKGYVDLMIGG